MTKRKTHGSKTPPPRSSTWLQKVRAHCRAVFVNHWIHWLVAVGMIFLGSLLSHRMEISPTLFDWRYKLYRFVQNPWAIQPSFRDVVVVTIDDDEYWQGDLARRVPIKRDYLARLVQELATAGPSVIALDFDLRSPDPTGKSKAVTADKTISIAEHPEYVEETAELLRAIDKLPTNVDVVLPKTLGLDESGYRGEADVYEGFQFSRPVRHGFISLSDDIRHIPRILNLSGGQELDSLAIAIVRAFRVDELNRKDWHKMMSASFIPRDPNHELRASLVLGKSKESRGILTEKTKGRVVLVGANWHRLGFGRGELVDSYRTPVGTLPGVFIHANYVQAILDGRSFNLFRWNTALEWLFGLLLTYITVLPVPAWRKGALFAGAVASPFVASYLALQNWGVYCDVGVVYALLLLHLLVERLLKPWIDRGRHP